jgi:hypothetical protein
MAWDIVKHRDNFTFTSRQGIIIIIFNSFAHKSLPETAALAFCKRRPKQNV